MDDMVGRGKMVMQKEGTPGYLNTPQWWLRQVLGGSTLWQGLVLEKRGYNGSPSPPFTHLLIMVLCFRSGSGFLL